ncbi:MAG: DUF6049 family protein [Frankiaceae bacterium]
MRRCRSLALAVMALAPLTLGAAPHARSAEPVRPAVEITLTDLEPRAPTPTDEVVLRGEVRNDGLSDVRRLRVRLRVSNEAVGSRSALAAQEGNTAAFGGPVSGPDAAVDLPDLPPLGHAAFTVRADIAALGFPRLGVYPIGVDLRGDDGDGVATLGRLRTWLPFGTAPAPGTTGPGARRVEPTTIAWLWPMADLPDRNPDGSFPSDRLAASIRSTGRLGSILAAAGAVQPRTAGAAPTPLTFAIDPALLEALAAMADGYLVHPPGARAVAGSGRAAAASFLHRLQQLTAANPVLALPYADPDLAAMVRAGRAADVGIATGSPTFRQLVERVLGTSPMDHIAWPPDGLAPQPTIDALGGVDTVVLSGAELPAQPSLSYTPDAATTLPALAGGTLRALVSDPTLDELVAADPTASGGVRLAEQRFLAETMLITAEKPAVSRSIVIAPPRHWAPPAAWAATLLRDSAQVPWLRPARIADLQPPPGASGRGPLRYPATAERAELPRAVFTARDGVAELEAKLDTFQEILTNQETAGIPALDRALLRCQSAAWRTSPGAGQALRVATRQALRDLVGKVRITTQGTVSLASKRSTIPISVANGLGQPVRVQVDLNSTAARLIAEDTGVKVIAGGHQLQLSVGLQAPGSGVFPLSARLLTPAGRPFGDPVPLRVYSSRYGKLALAITAGACAVLLLTAAARIRGRLRAAQRSRASR